ncbi:MAG: VWA domain-containing protein [Polyangiaceae bacterium]
MRRRRSAWRASWFTVLALGAGLGINACGSAEDENLVAGKDPGGTGGSTGKDGGGGSSCSDAKDCPAGSFCSAAKVCVIDGDCAVKEDCQNGDVCSASGKCLPPGSCGGDTDCNAGEVCDPDTKTCVPGGACGANAFAIEAVAPNLFISLDRSCSMTGAGGGGKTKWQIAVEAINKMLTDFNGKVRWGLGLFPDTVAPNCDQGPAQFAVADANESKIQSLLTASLQKSDPLFPDGPCVTNIDTAMQQASQEPSFADKSRGSYVLLITDGAQAVCPNNQGDPLTLQIITQLAANGTKTFVIGFGSGVKAASLNKFADAGGVPNNDPNNPNTHYYQASDAASLQTALGKIAGSIVGCTFTLDDVPPDPNQLYVFFDKVSLARDTSHQAGWDYDATNNQITFYGADCDKLKGNQVGKVDVVFGCNQPPR